MATITLGRDREDHIALVMSPLDRDFPDWLVAGIEVVAHPFKGSFTTEFPREALESWRDELSALYAAFRPGDAAFGSTWPLSGRLEIVVRVETTGRISVSGQLTAPDGQERQQTLRFDLAVDQSLHEVLHQVNAAIGEFHRT